MKVNIKEYLNVPLTKLVNSSEVKRKFPMIGRAEVYVVDDANSVILKIYINDPDLDAKNMLQKGLYPNYLISAYLKEYFPYYSISKYYVTGYVIVGVNGDIIDREFGTK